MHREATDLAGVRHIAYETLGSTNAEALALARAGERASFWVSAQSQSAGRGRRGRSWVSEPGNLYASLLLFDPAPAERVAQLSFVAALAVRDAIAQAAPALTSRLSLKWPNDVLLGGEKVAGILIEGEVVRGQPVTAVVGIGINCVSHPSEAAFPATDLRAQGGDATPPKPDAARRRHDAHTSRAMGPRRRLRPHPRRLACRRAKARGADPRQRRQWRADRAIRRPRCGRAAAFGSGDGKRQEIAAGDVFPLNLRAGLSDPLLRG